jgi:integrase
VLAAATGARTGELCGLEWSDLDLDVGTVRFRQALTNFDPAVLSGDPNPRTDVRRKELAVGPVKSAASNAILTLPPFALQALHHHRRQQARLRLALGQPATVPLRFVEPGRPPRPVELDLVFRTERGTPVNPNHASRTFARLAASVGLAAHPHMLRHALASAMAAHKEPASIIASQLRHADGGALPNASTSINYRKPHPGWLSLSRTCSAQRRGTRGQRQGFVQRREIGGNLDPPRARDPLGANSVSAA